MSSIKGTSSEVQQLQADEVKTSGPRTSLIYGLNDKPPVGESLFVALQHVLASFVGVITPPLIICSAIGLDAANTTYIISMALFVSGIGTIIQCRRVGPVGSGLLSLQGTSFTFLGPIAGVGTAAVAGGSSPTQALALIFGVCFCGAIVEIFISRILHLARKIITPVVSGTVVMTIGLSLIKTGIINIAGGEQARADGTFASLQHLAIGGLVLAIVAVLNLMENRILRMGAIAIGLITGYLIALFTGQVDFSGLQGLPLVNFPQVFRYGFDFNLPAYLPFVLLFTVTAIETIGDLTATSSISGEPIEGGLYFRRVKGGVLGDGCNSMLAAALSAFPVTTFSQNNGVIQMTGVGSRYVGMYVGAIFAILGLLPAVGGVLQTLPPSVLGGATLLMFGSIAVSGLRIVGSLDLTRRDMTIVALALAFGLGVVYVPDVLLGKSVIVQNVFSSGIATAGLTAIVLNLILPRSKEPEGAVIDDVADEAEIVKESGA